MLDKLILTTEDALRSLIREEVAALLPQPQQNLRLLTKNQVAKALKRSHATISKMCADGRLATTPDGMIPEAALIDYVNSKKSKITP